MWSTAVHVFAVPIAQFPITINSNVCPHIRVPNMLMRNPMHDVIGIFNSEACY